MTQLEIQKNLTDRLDKASVLYYNGMSSEFTDEEFDTLMHALQKLEKENNYVYPNSPTLRVGSDIQKEFKKIKHPRPMLTIENTYNDSGLEEWKTKIEEKISENLKYNISVKYDGISCEIHYKYGYYASASTRGDKLIGDDITENVKTIKSVPLFIECISTIPDFYVRGEVLLPKSRLWEINQERLRNDEQMFANTRNACSGSLKQLDPKITASRGLIFRAWDCFYLPYITSIGEHSTEIETMEEKAELLKKMGFKYEDSTEPITVESDNLKESVNSFKETLKSLNLDYDYDGVVVKIDDCYIQDCVIGTKDTRAIEWGIARKWNEEYVVKTELMYVDWQVGRTGVLTPVGRLDPVTCNGVVISNVTLHNVDFVAKNNLHLGNMLTITRSGGVIPYVVDVDHRGELESCKVEIPTVCPICGSPVVKDGALLKCINDKCPAVEKGKILQFCSKECVDIKTIGESVVEDLYENGLITNIEDLLFQGYRACIDSCLEEDIKSWVSILGEGYGEKSVRNILEGIAYARLNVPYDKLLSGLSIPGVGKVMARELAKKYDSVFTLMDCTVEGLMEIEGIAEKSATAIYDWVQNNRSVLWAIDSNRWNWMIEAYDVVDNSEPENNEAPLKNLTVCFTGKSSRFKGDDIESYLESKGAKCTHSVSKSMNYLITGDKPGGSKVEKAKSFGVEIISEQEFYDKFNI